MHARRTLVPEKTPLVKGYIPQGNVRGEEWAREEGRNLVKRRDPEPTQRARPSEDGKERESGISGSWLADDEGFSCDGKSSPLRFPHM